MPSIKSSRWLIWVLALSALATVHASTAAGVTNDTAQLTVAQAPNYRSDVETGATEMTPAQAEKYRAEYQAAKTQWSKMTPQQKAATIESARAKKLKDLSMIELVGQRDDMQRETAAQTAQYRAEAQAAKAKWDKLTPAEKQAVRRSAWQKKRSELDAMERESEYDH